MATSDLTFQVESYNTLLNDGASLFKKHWEEIALYKNERKLHINHSGFFEAEKNKRLMVLTVRNSSEIIGYAVFTFGISTHYSIVVASNDAFYVHPYYRKGWTAIKFMKFCLKKLKQTKADQIIWRTKGYQSFGPILERLGMKEDDVSYSMMINNKTDGEDNG